jgi:CBS domain containing-hemolysin-like protein
MGQAFFAGSEIGVISFNRIRLRHLVERGHGRAMLIHWFLEDPQRLFGTTLVGVNVLVVIGSTVASDLVSRHVTTSETWGPIIATGAMLPLVVLLGQIVPMSLFRSHSTSLVPLSVTHLRRAYTLLLPAVHMATFVSRNVARVFGGQDRKMSPFTSRDELRLLLEGRTKEEFLHQDGLRMLRRVFELQGTYASEVMVPLIEVTASPIESSLEQIIGVMKRTGFSTIPVYQERVDNIVGTVHAADLMGVENLRQPVKQVMKKSLIVPESKPVDDILLEFQRQEERFAVVVDEYGGVSGILTMEDIIEEIVGEIADEYEGVVPRQVSTRKGKVVVEGRMSIREFNEEFSTNIPDEKAETVGGLLTVVTGRVPQPGEEIHSHGISFEILEASDRKVFKLAIKPLTKGGAGSR